MSVIMYRLKSNGRAAVVLPDGFLFGTDNTKLNIKKKLLSEFNLHTIVRLPQSVFAPYTGIATNILFFDKTGSTKEIWFYRVDMPEGYKHFSKTKPIKLEHLKPCQLWWETRQVIRDTKGEDSYKANKYSAEDIKANNYNLDLCGYPTVEEEILSPEETILHFQEKRAILNNKIDRQIKKIEALLGGDA